MAKASTSTASEAAQRYASALFDLAQDKGQLAAVHKDFAAISTLIEDNDDLSNLVVSPAFTRDEKTAALTEIAREAGVSPLVVNFIGVMARNGRARDIGAAHKAFDMLYANQRGVRRATVRTAAAMTGSQRDRVAAILNHRRPAPGAAATPAWAAPGPDRRLAQAVEIMQAHIERPLPIAEIAARVDCPGWRLRRLFMRRFGMGPQAYYLELRLERARDLLRHSTERVGSVALICGFPAGEALARAYRARFGVAPSRDRAPLSGGER
ncbi:MAG: ATP synthase F1 subunit delta [Pseudomonadota bacterium]